MSDPAKPICPHCGAPLLARTHGDLTCVSHGTLVRHDLLDQLFGAGTASRVTLAAIKAPQAPRKCPLDRYATSHVRSAGGLEGDACGRCGSLWIPWASVDAALRTTPAPTSGSPSEQRSLMALAVARSLAGITQAPARR